MPISLSTSSTIHLRPLRSRLRGPKRASGAPVSNDSPAIDRWRTTTQQSWQKRAGEYARRIPELNAGISYLGRKGAGAIIRAVQMDSNGDFIPDDDPRAQMLAKTLITFDMQRAIELLVTYGKFYAIELHGKWIVASIKELQEPDGEGKPWKAIDTEYADPRPLWDATTPIQDIPKIIEIWRPSRDFAAEPWAATASLLAACETLVLIRARRQAYYHSRAIGSGVVYLPSEAMMPEIINDPTTGYRTVSQNALAKFQEAARIVMRDPEAMSGIIPIFVTGPAEYADSFKRLEFDNPDHHDKLKNDEQDALISMATGMDLPRAVALNEQGDAQFWASWEISRDVIFGYVKPNVGEIAKGITNGWYIPLLEANGVPNTATKQLEPDIIALLPPPNEVSASVTLYQAGLITDEAVVQTAGYSVDHDMMRPGSPEYERWKQRLKDQGLGAVEPLPPEPPAATDVPALIPPGSVPPDVQPGVNQAASVKALVASLAREIPKEIAAAPVAKDQKLEKLAKTLNAIDAQLRQRLQGAAERTIQVAMRKAASRVNSKANGKVAVKAMIAKLGPTNSAVIAALGLVEKELVQDEIDSFAADAAEWFDAADRQATAATNAALGTNHDSIGKAEDRRAAVAMLAAGMLALAQAKLHQPDITEEPKGEVSGLRVPAPLVTGSLARAGGTNLEIRGTALSPSIHWIELPVAAGPATTVHLDSVIAAYANPDTLKRYEPGPPRPPSPPPPGESQIPRQDGRKTPKRWLIWRHGTPQVPFKPHQELDGVKFDMWNDDRLGFTPGDNTEILGTGAQIGGWRPGDHRGCTCTIDIEWDYS